MLRAPSALQPPGLSPGRSGVGPGVSPPWGIVLARTPHRNVQLKSEGIPFLWHCVDMPIVGRWLAFVARSLGVSWLREPLRRQRCLGLVSSFRATDAAVRGRVLTQRCPRALSADCRRRITVGAIGCSSGATRCAALVLGGCAGRWGVLPVGGLTRRARRLPCVTTPDSPHPRGVAARRRPGGGRGDAHPSPTPRPPVRGRVIG